MQFVHPEFVWMQSVVIKMGGCSAEFCNNSTAKGYSMIAFPRNPQRRILWIENVGRKNWTPGKYSCLCEVHFALEMWEQTRVDGKKKLKPNAVPTIFGFFLKKKMPITKNENDEALAKDKNNARENVLDQSLNNKNQDVECVIITNTSESSPITDIRKNKEDNDARDNVLDNDIFTNQSLNNENQGMECEIITNTADTEPSPITDIRKNKEDNDTRNNVLDNYVFTNQSLNNENQAMECEIITNTSDNESSPITVSNNKEEEIQCEHKNAAEIISKQHLQMINMRRKLKAMRKTIQTLKTKINTNKYKAALNSIFTEDQIQVLFTKKRIKNWSHKTIHRVLQLKFVCGDNGYEELIKQGYPFPNLRTLKRKLEDFKFEPGISDKI